MKHAYIDKRKKNRDNIPEDHIAISLERKQLWRRASQRWLELLVSEKDEFICETILKRISYCLHRSMIKY